MARARTIQIFLPSGDPRGIRMAHLTTSIVQVIEVPRSLLAEFQATSEASQVGLYFLVGDNDGGTALTYIGQSGEVGVRLTKHHKEKDFWNRVLVVVSQTKSLTLTHVVALEWLSIKEAVKAGRYSVENANAGSKPHTPAPLEADCQEIFETLRTLLATMGQPIFEPLASAALSNDGSFTFSSSEFTATGEYTEEGFVVLKGSTARGSLAQGLVGTAFEKRRQALIDDGSLKLTNGVYEFQRDVLFNSPSGAAGVVAGSSTNGWVVWKASDGKTLDELKRSGA
ncbi:MAG: GIY-YIG nuclease family protein [Myxococcaceae bacterium]|nr:GIY-YIG nuclease family protein [Myxococcaceae bacterium]